jgi:hypothetical protein
MKTPSITVTWKSVPASGITDISLVDLNCKTKKEWNALGKEEQKNRLNKALFEYDGGELKPRAVEW